MPQEQNNQPPADPNSPSANQETKTPPASGSTEASSPSNEPTDLGGDDKTQQPPVEATDLGGEDEELDENGQPKAKAEETPPWAEYHGAPVDEKGAPAEYTDLVAPDGMPMDEELLAEATPVARELNLSKKGAQKLVDLKAKDVQIQVKRWTEHLADSKKEAMADPEIGGSNYAPAVSRGKALIQKFGDAELRKDLNTYGMGARRSMIRFLNKVATAIGETPLAPSGGAGAGATQQKPLHDILYRDPPEQGNQR